MAGAAQEWQGSGRCRDGGSGRGGGAPGPRRSDGAGAPQGWQEHRGRTEMARAAGAKAYQRNANSRSDKPGPWPGLLQGQTCMQIPHP